MGINDGLYRLVPVRVGDLGGARVPERLSMLGTLDLQRTRQPEREYTRLIAALRGPVPAM
jgi:hypothetical protein